MSEAMLFTGLYAKPVQVTKVGNLVTIPLTKYYTGNKIEGSLNNEYIVTRGYSWTLPGKGNPEVTIKV